MLHLFYIHSEITYIVSKCIIEYKGIDRKDIVFLLTRNFQPPTNRIKSFSIPFDPEKTIKGHINIFKSLKELHIFNRYLKKIAGNQSFYAYVPHTKLRSIQLIINHRKCKAFSIFEEGTNSYINYGEIEKAYPGGKISIFDKLGYLNKIRNDTFIDERYEHIYGISEYSFPNYPRRIILHDLFRTLQNRVNGKYNYLNNSAIIVLDGSSHYNELEQGVHVLAILNILRFIREHDIGKAYYKLHPAQLNTLEEKLFTRIFDEYSSGINIKRLGNNISLEEVIMSKQNLTFFINISSVGLYALMNGHNVFSTMKTSMDLDDKFKECVEHYPDFFKKKLKYIQ